MSLTALAGTIGSTIQAVRSITNSTSDDIGQIVKDASTAAAEGNKAYKEAFKKYAGNVDVRFGYGKEQSLTAVLSKYIIEPSIFISKDVAASCPDIKDKAICECIDLFTTLFSQCFHTMVNIEGKDTNVTVGLMGTSDKNYTAADITLKAAGDVVGNTMGQYGYDENQVKSGLTALKKVYDKIGMESMDMTLCDLKARKFLTFEPGVESLKDKLPGVEMPKDQISMGFHIRNFEITINTVVKRDPNDPNSKDKPISLRIPFTVRANIVELNVDHMCAGMTSRTKDKTFWHRWHKWRSGAISFWKDLVFCSDLIKEDKKAKTGDKSGIMRKIDYAKYNSRMSDAEIGKASMERFYNMIIVTPSDLKKIYQVEKGDIHNLVYKEKLFENLNALMLLNLDPEWEMGELFLKDLKGVSTIKFENIGKRKGNGMDGDLNTLFRSLYASNAPAF